MTSERVQFTSEDVNPATDVITQCKPLKQLDAVYGGPLDFRAPSNFVFLPHWMFQALGLKPLDAVQVELHTTEALKEKAKQKRREQQAKEAEE